MSLFKKESIFRNAPQTDAARDAYDDLKDWALDVMMPRLKKEIRAKLEEVAKAHGVQRKEVALLLFKPPVGERRKDLVEFLYNTLFS